MGGGEIVGHSKNFVIYPKGIGKAMKDLMRGSGVIKLAFWKDNFCKQAGSSSCVEDPSNGDCHFRSVPRKQCLTLVSVSCSGVHRLHFINLSGF